MKCENFTASEVHQSAKLWAESCPAVTKSALAQSAQTTQSTQTTQTLSWLMFCFQSSAVKAFKSLFSSFCVDPVNSCPIFLVNCYFLVCPFLLSLPFAFFDFSVLFQRFRLIPASEPRASEHFVATARLSSLGASPSTQTHRPVMGASHIATSRHTITVTVPDDG